MPDAAPALTVAICTYRRPDKLRRALEAIGRQTLISDLDVIVVDDGSGDETPDVARAFPFARVVQHPDNRGLGAGRNTAMAAARTSWVAFTDDDCLPEPAWAERLLDLTREHPDAFAVGGRVVAVAGAGVVNAFLRAKSPFGPLELTLEQDRSFRHRLLEYLRRSATAESGHGAREVASLAGANMALRRAAVERLGGWDSRFVFGGEEEELFRRAREQGMRIIWDPRTLVEHAFDDSVRDLVLRSHHYGRGNARMQAKHGGLPTLYPAPVLVTAGLAAAPLTRLAPIVALLLPQVVFSIWPRKAWEAREPRALLFPYLQVLQEAASDVGWVSAALLERRQFQAPASDPEPAG